MPTFIRNLVLASTLVCHAATCATAAGPEEFQPRFYVFANGVAFGDYAEEAQTIKRLGFDGISQVNKGGSDLARRIEAYEKLGLRVQSTYVNAEEEPVSAELVKPLAGRDAMIELTVRKMSPKTVQSVRATAEMAASMKIRVALYPHHGFAIATMPQAQELIEQVDHPNLGVMFNLCHFIRNERVDDLEGVLDRAGDRLFAVSTNGANSDGKDWGELIMRLDQGDFSQERLFRKLRQLGFSGPVSLQCYNVRGDKRGNLQLSIAAWRKLLGALGSVD